MKSKNSEKIIEIRDISLDFGNMKVLDSISLDVLAGEIHAVVGEHGAGKSSICNIFSGIKKPAGGDIFIRGKNVTRKYSGKEAVSMGINLVSQHTTLCEHLTIAKNIYMNQISFHKRVLFDYDRVKKEIRSFLSANSIDLDINKKVVDLIQSDRVFVDILRHLYSSPSVIILDEALEKLTGKSLGKVLGIINEMKEKGMGVLFVTHRIDDVYRFADRVSVVRHGGIIMTESVKDIDKFNLIKLAYTKFHDSGSMFSTDKDFYNLLKYNEAILESLPVNMLVVDTENRIKLINRRGSSFFRDPGKNITPKITGLPFENLFPSGSQLLEKLKKAVSEGSEKIIYNEIYISQNGRSIVNINTIPIKDGNWRIGTIIMVDDVTEQVKLREQIFFSEKLASIGILSAGVAHEINNPLEILQNNIDYLREKFINDSGGDFNDILNEMGEEIDTIANIVGSLASVSGEKSINRVPVDISSLLISIARLVKPYAEARKTVLSLDLPETGIVINADKTELRQIFLNILKNSFEALPEGGRITVYTIHEKSCLNIVFEDNGRGIGDEDPENIFLPFYSTKKNSPGNLGLGLYMTWRLVSDNSGSIEAENIETGGCRFTLKFPIK